MICACPALALSLKSALFVFGIRRTVPASGAFSLRWCATQVWLLGSAGTFTSAPAKCVCGRAIIPVFPTCSVRFVIGLRGSAFRSHLGRFDQVDPQFSFSADAQHTDSAARLLSYQTVMACVSDIDISHIYPQMQVDPGSLMHSLAAWGPERLLRVSNWRSGKDNSKDVVRNYARAVLALADLHRSAQTLSLAAASRGGQNSTRSAPRTSKTMTAAVSEDTSSHALAPRKRTAPLQIATALVALPSALEFFTAGVKPRLSWAPSARLLSVFRN